MNIDPRLLDFANDNEANYIRASMNSKDYTAAGELLGVHRSTVQRAVDRVTDRAAIRGYAPESDFERVVPSNYAIKRISTNYDGAGEVKQQWVISSPSDEAKINALRETVEGLIGDSQAIFQPIEAPRQFDADLMTVIPMGDPHVGMFAWAAETGTNFDLKIAEKLMFESIDYLCSMTPNSKVGVLLNLGDFFHADNNTNRTPRSGANLDVDGRFQKVAAVGVRAMVRCIRRMLEKHETVIVRNNPGNHDPHQAIMLTLCLDAWFHDEPRVHVDVSPNPFWYYRFGKTLIGSTHGDGAKLADLPLIMASDRPQEWAASEHRVWHCGHFHHDQIKDLVGCTMETHRTMAGLDAWHNHQGYRSKRDMKAIVYHKDFGEAYRMRCPVARLTPEVNETFAA